MAFTHLQQFISQRRAPGSSITDNADIGGKLVNSSRLNHEPAQPKQPLSAAEEDSVLGNFYYTDHRRIQAFGKERNSKGGIISGLKRNSSKKAEQRKSPRLKKQPNCQQKAKGYTTQSAQSYTGRNQISPF
jgi:hypothetical protein